MAIVTISRIQHRRGLYENLPQLSAAEFGWAIDKRRLFIGNGPVSEDAPEVGNTEILTEFSDVLSTAQTYTFKNSNGGFAPSTGPSGTSPIVRTLQNKLDDFVSVMDFGAKGDGATDDTAAINRALYQLYCTQIFSGMKRALYFPAGHYIISETINVPPNATILGEGPYSTIIEHQGDLNDYPYIVQTADSKQQTGGNIGIGADLPSDIMIANMGLICGLNGIYISHCKRITLNRIRFTGPESMPNTTGSSVSLDIPAPSIGIYITGSSVHPSEDINLLDCYVQKFNYGILQSNLDQFFRNVIIQSVTFQELYGGILINGGSTTSEIPAKNLTITSSVFDIIYTRAVDLGLVHNFASSFNYYREVGTQNAGAGSPQTSVIRFGALTNHSASLGDLFDRPDADDLVHPRVETLSANTSYFEYGDHLGLGYLSINNGQSTTLTDNTAGGTVDSFKQDRYPHLQIIYRLTRNGDLRSGIVNIATDGTTVSIDDDSTETADVGVVFSATADGTDVSLEYTTTSTGNDAILYYSVKRLNDVV